MSTHVCIMFGLQEGVPKPCVPCLQAPYPGCEQVAPITVHPAFNKAAAYFDLTMVLVPVDDNSQVDVAAMSKAITNNTILLVGSAPQYPHAVVDPIEDIAALAKKFGTSCSGTQHTPLIVMLRRPTPARGCLLWRLHVTLD